MSAERRKGTGWESAIVDYLREQGWLYAERRALSGRFDRGDVAGVVGVVIEAKSAAKVELAAWLDEANAEAVNDHADLGVVWFKRRRKASPAGGFVLMDGVTFVQLLRCAGYGSHTGCQECGNDDATTVMALCSDCLYRLDEGRDG